MIVRMVGLAAVAGALGLTLAVAVQPRRAWNEAAEHGKGLWGGWVLGLVAVGLVAPIVGEIAWSTTTWVAVCCGLAVAQPSLLADLREVRRHVRRAGEALGPVPPSPFA